MKRYKGQRKEKLPHVSIHCNTTHKIITFQFEDDSSPVRTVLGSLAGDGSVHPSRKSSMFLAKEVVSNNRKIEDRRPKRIEEVPFR